MCHKLFDSYYSVYLSFLCVSIKTHFILFKTKCYEIKTKQQIKYAAANLNGGGNGTISSATSNSSSNATTNSLIATTTLSSPNIVNELSFGLVHDAFGKEIQQNLGERKHQKELAERPLIDL